MKKKSKTTQASGKISIVFFGSGPVATKSLKLLGKNFDIEAIITKPSTINDMSPSAKDASVYSVKSKDELDELIASKPFTSKLGVLIDFGIIVSQNVINYFPLGIVNSHFSLLPRLRGADPITFSILQGDTKTGVSLMLIDSGMDTGSLLTQQTYNLPKDITTPELTNDLILLSDSLLNKYLPRYVAGDIKPYNQSSQKKSVTYSRKLTKEDGILDFNKPAKILEREIRAFVDWPKSRTSIAGKDVIITKATVLDEEKAAGVVTIENGKLMIGCGRGTLIIDALKPAGKPEMTTKAFLAGYKNLL